MIGLKLLVIYLYMVEITIQLVYFLLTLPLRPFLKVNGGGHIELTAKYYD